MDELNKIVRKNYFLIIVFWTTLVVIFSYLNIQAIKVNILFFPVMWGVGLSFFYLLYKNTKNSIKPDESFEKKYDDNDFEYLAKYDSLTTLPNRNSIIEKLESTINRGKRFNHNFAIFFIDLDNFKIVNDTMGHHIGDLLLKEVTSSIKGVLRNYDTLGRFAGDEFLLIVDQINSEEDIISIAEKIKSVFQEPFILDNYQATVSASMGIGIYPYDGEDAKSLLRNADIAMYMAKENGKNGYQFFTKEMNQKLEANEKIRKGLQSAITNFEFELHYQPQIDINRDRVVGAEVLLRWRKDGKLIYPNDFMDVAEKSGLIIPISMWILEDTIKVLKRWQKIEKEIKISINISEIQFCNYNFFKEMIEVIEKAKLTPKSLEIELSEEMIRADEIQKIDDLKKAGVGLVIDDFGRGYSSLNSMKSFNIDRVKIDKNLTDLMLKQSDSREILSAIISMSHSLKLTTIAKCIENREQLEFIREKNCDLAQGYYFYKPLTKNNFEELIKKQNKII